MENITFHLVFLKLIYGNRKEDCLRLFKMFLLYDHIGPSLGPWALDPGAINFTIQVEDFVGIITMQYVFH